jgi:signal peptidase I
MNSLGNRNFMTSLFTWKNFSNTIMALFWLLILFLVLIKLLVFQQVTVVGKSMEPNYFDYETLLVNQLDKNLQRGQVVAVFRDREVAKTADYFTRFHATFYLKRIIGLPGEEIEMLGSKVIIYNAQNPEGVVLNENYIDDKVKNTQDSNGTYYQRLKIPEKSYFLMGDNRTNSTDSRVLGAFPDYSIFGQETMRFWPFDRTEFFKLPNYTFSIKESKLDEDLKQAALDYQGNLTPTTKPILN